MEPLKILIVDDHKIIIDGIKNMLNSTVFKIVSEAGNISDAIAILEKQTIDIMITDIKMPEGNGLELIAKVKEVHPDVKIVVLSMHDEISIVVEAINLGVNAYLLKNISQKMLIRALHRVSENNFFISEELSHILMQNINSQKEGKLLTKREMQILNLIAKGYSSKQISDSLFISQRTVESHRKSLLYKTKTNNAAGLINYAFVNGLLYD